MTRQSLPIILIFMILITPIASAFDHCAGMDITSHLSESQSMTGIISADGSSPSNHKKMFKGQTDSSADRDCDTSSNCTFHLCAGYGLTSSALTIDTIISSYYSNFEYIVPYNTALSADLRPPIFIL